MKKIINVKRNGWGNLENVFCYTVLCRKALKDYFDIPADAFNISIVITDKQECDDSYELHYLVNCLHVRTAVGVVKELSYPTADWEVKKACRLWRTTTVWAYLEFDIYE